MIRMGEGQWGALNLLAVLAAALGIGISLGRYDDYVLAFFFFLGGASSFVVVARFIEDAWCPDGWDDEGEGP